MKNTIHQKLARTVMGKNFFGVEDWLALYDANFSQEQLLQVAEFPWGKDILNSACPLCGKVVKNCHFAFVGLDRLNGKPLTILKLQELHPATGQPKFASYASNSWYSTEKFAKETTMDFRWYLLHQNIVPKSQDKAYNYEDQKAMLTADYEVPSVITEVTKDLLVFRKTRSFVNRLCCARCKPLFTNSSYVRVGSFNRKGLCITDSLFGTDVALHYRPGVAASRKFPSTSSG